ncbi:MAG: hypothetical protein GXP57_01680 [Deltaproteobacteria bacterium]|nr:hypothetical protein [Deltaproteobacteria bacterium]
MSITITIKRTARVDRTPLLLRESRSSGSAGRPDTASGDETGVKDATPLVCRRCRAVITGRDQAIVVNDAHLHAFFNPAGVVYEIRCFRRAPGCFIHGRPTSEFTWFSGYSWQFCLCSTCLTHLGWFFSAADFSFYGLIGNRLDAG